MSRYTAPLHGLPGEQAGFAEALLAPALPCPPGLQAWNGSDPARRLAVYRNNVMVSLIDALATSFPVAQELVGEDFFRAMAAEFVRRQPPRSRVLARYGDRLPDFIADFEPARSVPYLADLARLEFARIQAYHAADAEALSPAAAAAALRDGADVGRLVLICHPSVVALDRETKKLKGVGLEAKRMLGRTPDGIMAVRPMKDGVIADYRVTEMMLRYFLRKALPRFNIFKPDVMVSVPAGASIQKLEPPKAPRPATVRPASAIASSITRRRRR